MNTTPQNCGTSHCSCIECVKGESRQAPAKQPLDSEREVLIKELERTNFYYQHGKALGLAQRCIDMLAADAEQLMQVTAHRDHCLTVVDKLKEMMQPVAELTDKWCNRHGIRFDEYPSCQQCAMEIQRAVLAAQTGEV